MIPIKHREIKKLTFVAKSFIPLTHNSVIIRILQINRVSSKLTAKFAFFFNLFVVLTVSSTDNRLYIKSNFIFF